MGTPRTFYKSVSKLWASSYVYEALLVILLFKKQTEIHQLDLSPSGYFPIVGFQIFVKTSTGDTISISVQPDDTIKVIKLKIEEKENIEALQQILLYGGMELDDNKYLSDYNIQFDSMLHLVVVQSRSKYVSCLSPTTVFSPNSNQYWCFCQGDFRH